MNAVEIIPREEDFIFIRPGGQWLKLREETNWNRERLRSLQVEYSKCKTDLAKRFFIGTVVETVKMNGGRFLRGATVEKRNETGGTKSRIVWHVVDDGPMIFDSLQRIIRQMNASAGRDRRALIVDLQSVETKIDKINQIITAFRSNLEQYKKYAQPQPEVKRPRIAKCATPAKKRKVLAKFDSATELISDLVGFVDQWVAVPPQDGSQSDDESSDVASV